MTKPSFASQGTGKGGTVGNFCRAEITTPLCGEIIRPQKRQIIEEGRGGGWVGVKRLGRCELLSVLGSAESTLVPNSSSFIVFFREHTLSIAWSRPNFSDDAVESDLR